MFKKMLILAGAVLLVSFYNSTLVIAEEKYEYIGVKKCSICHKMEKKGDQYGKWLATRHAHAFETLATPEAMETAKAKGIEGNPQEAPECLKCHVTAYGVDQNLLGEGFKPEEGVQCESCHGAGGGYAKLKIMKDQAQAIENGLIMPTKEVCVKCHNEEAPNFYGFDFDEMYPKIQHPDPSKE